jgi:hypothetical protein
MPSEISPLEELQRIVKESTNQLCIHSTRLRSTLELRNTRVAELEKTVHSIDMRITALAGRGDVSPSEAFELLAIIKAACSAPFIRKGTPS